jgi:hypothetical protein
MRGLLVAILLLATLGAKAQEVFYLKSDSVKVVSLLRKAQADKPSNLMLYFAHLFEGVPYVAHTLEISTTEKLIINLRELDCTTLVETVFALALTAKQGSVRWDDYCTNLSLIRYRNGKPEGYASRNHYFYWWVESNMQKKLITLPDIPTPLRYRQVIDVNYMSNHVDSYRMLKAGGAKVQKLIKDYEKASFGKVMYYIPAAQLGAKKSSQLSTTVHDGDILAIVTRRQGLDTSHIGIAEWGSDGFLHLLNASKLAKKVILDSRPINKYMATQRLQQGVWVIRPNL